MSLHFSAWCVLLMLLRGVDHGPNRDNARQVRDNDQPACAGGPAPPRPCLPGDYKVPNPERSACVCMDGYFEDNNACTLCTPGYFCTGGNRSQCPEDTYVETAGATKCKPCEVNGMAIEPCNSPVGAQLPRCDPRKKDTQNRRPKEMCVPCSSCSSEFYYKVINPTANEADVTFCYRQFNSY